MKLLKVNWIFAVITALQLIFFGEVHAKRILLNVDGTSNDPTDGEIKRNLFGEVQEDDLSISNVLKLHLLAGGKLDNSQAEGSDQYSFYYYGVGNRHRTDFMRKLSAGFAISEPAEILEELRRDLTAHYDEGDEVILFGFSRGAAIARIFAQELVDDPIIIDGNKLHPKISFLGLWDTVAALKGPDMDTSRLPPPSDLKEKEGKIAINVDQALHLLAIDDPRIAFRPTQMGHDGRVQEVWFAGVHSDIGGGYKDDALSDLTLKFMLDRASNADVGIVFMDANDSSIELGTIERDRLIIDANVLGERMHLEHLYSESRYKGVIDKVKDTLDYRALSVVDIVGTGPAQPLIHETVLERIEALPSEYCPTNLQAINGAFSVLRGDGSIETGKSMPSCLPNED